MDPATIIGVVLALGAVVGSTFMEGGNIAAIFLPAPMVLVFLGTAGAAIAGGVMRDVSALPKTFIKAFTAKKVSPDDAVETIVSLAGRARREGLLALEEEVNQIEDEFLRKGLQLAIDGTDAEEVAIILEAEVSTKKKQDRSAAKIFTDMGGFAPTVGIIGTVLGLVKVLSHLGSPEELGAEIASAFVATLWGVMSANLFWLPMGNRLKRVSETEVERMEIIIEGILSIQSGSNPRLVEQKLLSLIPGGAEKAAEKDAA
ncbi:flagellar motor protein [Jatrophihabitans telluris]|uniref:Flagellar motor protein n=1 Tax=Jatrophihabitans telluris TaxID=2038343 RepID=A0ABY4QYG5_9ACTN|nr:flagellar motor protein [Jatrophihabitans telluris]UQX87960.1 flagellar motor protein [Jatrophihabitans telluris]